MFGFGKKTVCSGQAIDDIVAGISGAIDQLSQVSECANTRVEHINDRIEILIEERKACNATMDRADRIAKKLEGIIE